MNLGLNSENCISRIFISACLMITLLGMIGTCFGSAEEMYNASQAMISKDKAAEMVIESLVKNLTENSNLKMGLQVNQYPELLDAGVEVREAIMGETMPSRVLVCQNDSWLFFLDLAPLAHFAHPVIIALIDAVSGKLQTMDAQWWPVLEKPVFANETQRQDPKTIIFEKEANL
jgi:hypothetical protein